MSNLDVSFKNSIATKLITSVFSIYIIVALIITSFHMISEYRRVRRDVIEDLKIFHLNLGPAVSIAIWDADVEQMRRILEGMIKSPIILGVKVTDTNGREVGSAGQIHQINSVDKGVAKGGLNFRFPLVYIDGNQKNPVGEIEFISGEGVVFDKVKYGFLYILVAAIVKAIVLWGVFLFFCKMLLQNPLARLAEAAGKVDFENLEKIDINIQTKDQNELKVLENVFKSMISKLIEGRKQEAEINIARFGHIFQESLNEIYLFNVETFKFTQANREAHDNLGYSAEEIKNLTSLDLKPEFTVKTFKKLVSPLLNNEKKEIIFETVHKRKNGSLYDVEVHLQLLKLASEMSFVEIILDITARKKAEREKEIMALRLRQSQKLESVGTLAGGIAHDFNNILGVITGNISYLLSSPDVNSAFAEVLIDVQDGAWQAQKLTQQLLTFSKGGAPIKKTADIHQVIKESAEFVSRGSKAKCVYDFSDDLWPVEIDSGQINQVINNLVINADQSMPTGGIIYIRTENIVTGVDNKLLLPEGQFIKISIEDEGIGITKKNLENIFDPYFTTKQRGSGLGLATSYSIINRHGGSVTVYSEPDRGTVFHFYLPASLNELKPVEERKKTLHLGHGKILIMDDQEQVLKMAGRLFGKMGYEVSAATDGAKAIEIYRAAYEDQQPFDLVILDLTVPGGLGGEKTIPELLKINPKVKVAVSSGYSNDPIMANFEDYGFIGIIPKPYSKDQVAVFLNRVLGEKD